MAALTAREKGAAAAMYNFLVTPSGTKIAHGIRDLAGYASVDEDEAAGVLQRLTAERIVRASSTNGPSTTRYEIFHDVLADAVVAWRTRFHEQQALEAAERRRRRALLLAAIALTGLLVVAAIAIFALVERSHARGQERHARAGRLVAEARTTLDVDPRQSIALALHAAGLERSRPVEDTLRDSLLASRLRAVVAAMPIVARGPDFFVTVDRRDSAVKVRNAGRRGGLLAKIYPAGVVNFSPWPPAAPLSALALGRDSVAEGSEDGQVRVWIGRRAPHTRHVRGRIASLSFSPDGRTLLVVSRDRAARLLDASTGRVAHVLLHGGFVNAAAFSPDGRVVVTGAQDWTGRIWDARSGRLLHELPRATGGITAIAFSPDGKLVALASSDAVARVYDVKSGAIRFYLSGDTNAINDIGFSPDGRALVTASSDRTVRVWTADVGRPLTVLRGHTDAVLRAFFTSDGQRVVSAGADGTVRVWDPGSEPELRVVAHQQARFAGAVRNRDGTITVIDVDGVRHVLDAHGKHVIRTAHGAPPQPRPARATHGNLVARVTTGGIDLIRSGRVLRELATSADTLEFSPDGRLLAAGGHDHYLRVWDVASGRLLYAVVAHQGPIEDVGFSPDGRWIVTAGPISAGVWSADTGRPLLPAPLRGPTQPLHAALFTRDGRTIVTAGYDGTIRRYDCVACGTLPQLVAAANESLAQTRPR
jgi:WD40 repeat protein